MKTDAVSAIAELLTGLKDEGERAAKAEKTHERQQALLSEITASLADLVGAVESLRERPEKDEDEMKPLLDRLDGLAEAIRAAVPNVTVNVPRQQMPAPVVNVESKAPVVRVDAPSVTVNPVLQSGEYTFRFKIETDRYGVITGMSGTATRT